MNHVRYLIPGWRQCGNYLFAFILSMGVSHGLLASEVTDREQIFEEAKALLRDNKAEQAYQLLAAYEMSWSGGDAYDYLLGVAALDSQNPGEAVFSLQRLVTRRPAFSGARMELARAFYDLGDNELARAEFERLLQEDPPEKVRQTIDSYLEAINTRARTYTASSQYFFDFGAGYDTNPVASTDENQFLGFVLAAKNQEQPSAFSQVTIGAMWNKPISAETQIMLNASLMHRSNPSTHFVDPSLASIGAAIGWHSGKHMANLGITASESLLNRKSNKQNYAVSGSYVYKLTSNWNFNSFASYGALRFDSPLEIQDVNQTMLGLGIEKANNKSLFNITALGTIDDSQQTGSTFGNDGFGLQISDTWYFENGSRIFVNLSGSRTEYDEPFFALNREDDLLAITVGETWARFPAKDWTLTMQVSYSEKDSTVDLYDFSRWEVGLFLRKVFN